MGDYYEGNVDLNIDTSKIDFDKLVSILNDLMSNKSLGCNILFNFPKEIAEKLYDNYTNAILSDEEDADYYNMYQNYYELIKEDNINKLKYNPNDSTSITINIECCTKYYIQENIESIISNIIDNLKEYMFEYNNLQDAGYVGTIGDEDNTYYKQFFCREDILPQILEQRSKLCNKECPLFIENCLCEDYSMCNRAYEIGRKNSK